MQTFLRAVTKAAIILSILSGCQDIQDKISKKKDNPNELEKESSSQESPEVIESRYHAIAAELNQSFAANDIKTLDNVGDLSSQRPTISPNLPNQFCIHAYKLPLQADFSEELGYFCDEKKQPKQLFSILDRHAKLAKEFPMSLEISHKIDGDYSTSVVAVAYEIPIPPKFVKEAGIPYYMVSAAKFPYFNQSGGVLKKHDGRMGGDLQFNKFDLRYETINRTSDGKTFENAKLTEFNGYQVQGGNSDIGLGTEHLVGENPNYKYFKTITITIGTESGGSIMINFANITVKHNGYPKDARTSAYDIGVAQGNHVRAGVMKELPDRIIK